MKNIIISIVLTGFVFAVQAADDKGCADKQTAGCCAKAKETADAKSECSMTQQAKAQCCLAAKNQSKAPAVKQTLTSPKGGEASK